MPSSQIEFSDKIDKKIRKKMVDFELNKKKTIVRILEEYFKNE